VQTNPGKGLELHGLSRLVTRADLVENNIKSIEELAAKIPAFRASDAATAPWIPAVK